jgi:hypothetical protein
LLFRNRLVPRVLRGSNQRQGAPAAEGTTTRPGAWCYLPGGDRSSTAAGGQVYIAYIMGERRSSVRRSQKGTISGLNLHTPSPGRGSSRSVVRRRVAREGTAPTSWPQEARVPTCSCDKSAFAAEAQASEASSSGVRARRMQNSLPSGSARTTQVTSEPWPISIFLAPRATRRSTSASRSSGRRSR